MHSGGDSTPDAVVRLFKFLSIGVQIVGRGPMARLLRMEEAEC